MEMAEEALERIFCAAGDFDDCSVPLVLLERHHGVHQEQVYKERRRVLTRALSSCAKFASSIMEKRLAQWWSTAEMRRSRVRVPHCFSYIFAQARAFTFLLKGEKGYERKQEHQRQYRMGKEVY